MNPIQCTRRCAKFITALTFFLSLHAHAQFDSLRVALQTAKYDTTRLRLCLAIAAQQTNNNLDTTFAYCNRAEAIATKIKSTKGVADAKFQRAYAIYYAGDGDSAIKIYNAIITTYRSLGDSSSIAACLNKVGFIYREQGDRVKALESYSQALKSNRNEADKSEAGNSYLNIGLIHHDQLEYKEALKYELLGLSMYEQSKDINRSANALARIGNIYSDQKQDTIALTYYQRSLSLAQEAGHTRLIAINLNNMAMIYTSWGDLPRSLALYKQSLAMREKIGDKNGVALILNNIGSTYSELHKPDSALLFLYRSLSLSREINYKDIEMSNYLQLSILYKEQGQIDSALHYYVKYHGAYEAINNENSTTEINRLNASLESERKQKQIELLSKEGALKAVALEQERTKTWFLIFGIAVLVVVSVIVLINNRRTRKTNLILESQKLEIDEQKKIVEEQHRGIVDSINYALRIQHAVLPSRAEMKQHFPESFLIYKPRDIVSGDFWWITEKAGMKVCVVADCTGHGVPGAFMSLIGTSLLNELINEKGITDPGLVLNMLSERVVKSLHQNEERSAIANDGMDMAVAVIDEAADLLLFAGANNSLFYTTIDGELRELKGDRQPVGIHVDKLKPFRVHTMPLRDVTNLWMFTDGFVDQFCGVDGSQFGKKFKYSRMKTALTSVQAKSANQQREFLTQTFEDWKGNMFQVDDVLMIGIKFY